MDEIKIEKGVIIHIGGIPFELKYDIVVKGNKENMKLTGLTKK